MLPKAREAEQLQQRWVLVQQEMPERQEKTGRENRERRERAHSLDDHVLVESWRDAMVIRTAAIINNLPQSYNAKLIEIDANPVCSTRP